MASKKLFLKKSIAGLIYPLKLFSKANSSRKTLRVFMYHSITDTFVKEDPLQMTTPIKLFEEQMRFLFENNYAILPCEKISDFLNRREIFPERAVAITFDDGFRDNIKILPIVEKYDFPVTIFLTTDYIGSHSDYLQWSDIETLSPHPLISFGSHTVSHRKMSSLSLDDLKEEISLSKKKMEEVMDRAVTLFAYPYGSYGSFDSRAIRLLKSEGYRAAFTTIAGANAPDINPYLLRRTRISWHDDKKEFMKEVAGAYDWYELWQRMGKISRISC